MKKNSAEYWISQYQLSPHPEGGHFNENYRSKGCIDKNCLPSCFDGSRSYQTSIYFLLEKGQLSKLHRLKSDEIWFYHFGDAIEITEISPQGTLTRHLLGPDFENGEKFQVVIPAKSWFGAEIKNRQFGFSLAGCTVSPGFDFSDFEMAKKEELLKLYPPHSKAISRLT